MFESSASLNTPYLLLSRNMEGGHVFWREHSERQYHSDGISSPFECTIPAEESSSQAFKMASAQKGKVASNAK
jgi:hypothetical protein